MGLNWGKKLTIDNFGEFCQITVADLFLAALSATVNLDRAHDLSVEALRLTFSRRKEFAACEENIEPSAAVMECLKSLVNKTERQRLNSSLFKLGRDRLPDDAALNDIIKHAVNCARRDMPRYAPTISGIKGMIYVLSLVGAMIAVILVVWIDPFGMVADSLLENNKSAVDISASPRINTNFLCDVTFEQIPSNNGAIPVKIHISGPDAGKVDEITVRDSFGGALPVYSYNGEYYGFVAEKSGQYRCEIRSAITGGESPENPFNPAPGKMVRFTDAEVSSGAITLNTPYFVIPHDRLLEIDPSSIFDEIGTMIEISGKPSHGNLSIKKMPEVSSADSNGAGSSAGHNNAANNDVSKTNIESDPNKNSISASDASPSDSENTLPNSAGDQIYDPSGPHTYTPEKGFVGIDSFGVMIRAADGKQTEYTLPVLVVNSAPRCDPGALSAVVHHTPSHSGTAIGQIAAFDPDGDQLTYTLEKSEYCDVLLAPGGGFAAHIYPEARPDSINGKGAGFTFTVSDGILGAGPYEYQFILQNSLCDLPGGHQNFYCYSGTDGFIELDLPKLDADGDTLIWNIVIPQPGEGAATTTSTGSRVKVENGRVKYCVNPQLTASVSEDLVLSYTDGMATPKTINFTCNILPNPGPTTPDSQNDNLTIAAPDVDKNIVCEVKLKKFSPFYAYEIVDITSIEGTITPNTGWKQMKFTYSFKDGFTSGTALVTVRDVRSGQMAVIEHRIRKG